MKKLNVLFLSLVALGATVTSCSKDDEKPLIVAKWMYSTSTDTTGGTTTEEQPINNPSCTDKFYLDLSNSAALEIQVVGSSADPCAVTKLKGTYTYQNNVIHMTLNGQPLDYTVVSVTSTKLIVKSFSPDDATSFSTFTLIK